MDKFEKFMNASNDIDWGWQPFLYLKPAKTTIITNTHLAKMAYHYGAIVALIFVTADYLGDSRIDAMTILYYLIFSFILCFFGYKLSIAYFWNRRARRLRKKNK